MKYNINQKIQIEPKFLDKNFKFHLFDKLKKTMIGKCTLDYGYIIKINKIIKIGDNYISPVDSLVIFDVIYEAEVLKPEINQELLGKVCMVFKHGIFVDICGIMKVLIPVSSMKSYTFNKSSFNHNNGVEISVGTLVKIIIVMIKYEKKNFNCIGKLVNVLESKLETE